MRTLCFWSPDVLNIQMLRISETQSRENSREKFSTFTPLFFSHALLTIHQTLLIPPLGSFRSLFWPLHHPPPPSRSFFFSTSRTTSSLEDDIHKAGRMNYLLPFELQAPGAEPATQEEFKKYRKATLCACCSRPLPTPFLLCFQSRPRPTLSWPHRHAHLPLNTSMHRPPPYPRSHCTSP